MEANWRQNPYTPSEALRINALITTTFQNLFHNTFLELRSRIKMRLQDVECVPKSVTNGHEQNVR